MATPPLLHGTLTPRGKQVLQAIMDYTDMNGYPPTVREVGDIIEVYSPGTSYKHLLKLQQIGAVTWVRDSPRTLVVTPAGRRALESDDDGAIVSA